MKNLLFFVMLIFLVSCNDHTESIIDSKKLLSSQYPNLNHLNIAKDLNCMKINPDKCQYTYTKKETNTTYLHNNFTTDGHALLNSLNLPQLIVVNN